MRIGVVSDSHGDTYAVKRAIGLMGNIDLLVHLGDYFRDAERVSKELNRDIIYVRGNCDYSSSVELDRILDVASKRVMMTHGHKYRVKSDYLDLYLKALEDKIDLVLFGHTHFPEVFEKDGITFLNPGSVSSPRGTSETYAIVTIDEGTIQAKILKLY